MKIVTLVRPSMGGAGFALVALFVATACGDGEGPTRPDGGLEPSPPALSHGDFGDSDGFYRIPYADGSSVIITRDHHSHTPPNRIDMAGDVAGLEIVAAASGTIRAIVDRHGNTPGAGDGFAADGSTPQDDALEHSCQDSDDVVGSCSDYNNYVWIEHPNGEWTKYTHFGTGTVTDNGWDVGDWIEAGDVLGLEGDVGAASGRHLHHEVGIPDDPDDLTPFTELGGFMAFTGGFGVNVVPLVCDIDDNLYVDGVTYTANPCDHDPPTADAGGPYEVDEGATVMLDGSGSADPEGLPLTFAWTPAENMDDPSLEQPMFLGMDDGEVEVGLTVYDQVEALSASATATVTVLNVAPDVTIDESQTTLVDEGTILTVLAGFSDPGVLDAPFTATATCYDVTGFELEVDGTVEITSEDGPVTGTVTADCPIGDTSQSGDPLTGTFSVTVAVTDKDGDSGEASFDLTSVNQAPTPVMDLSDETLINGKPTILASAGETVGFSAVVTDPGSDDLFLTWDWDDGSTDPASYHLVDSDNPDPFPSPSWAARDITDDQSHAWTEACFYSVSLTALDDDGGAGADTAAVVITGDAGEAKGAGYWMTLYRRNRSHLPEGQLGCYLAISNHMSAVFDEERDGTDSFESATDMLWTHDSRGEMYHLLDRQLLTAWLNFAHGGYGWGDMVDTDGDGLGDTTFSDAITAAEMVRLDPDATREELEAQKDVLESISLMHGG